jgi:MFS family permease
MASPLFVLMASAGGVRSGAGLALGAALAVADAVSVALAVLAVADALGAGALGAAAALGVGAALVAAGVSDFVSQRASSNSEKTQARGRNEGGMGRDSGRPFAARQSWGVPRAASALPRAVILLGVTSLFTDIATEMVFPLLPVFIAALGGGATFLGLIEGLADATSSLLKLASGYFADRPGRKKPLVIFGYGLATLVRPFVALATKPWHVLVVRVTDRIGKGVRSSPRDALIAAAVPQADAGRAFGFHNAMDHAGAVIGPVTATLLLKFGLPLRTVFWLTAVPGVLALVAASIVREPAPAIEPGAAGAPAAEASTGAASSDSAAAPARPGRLPNALKSYCAILTLFALGGSSDAFLLLRARDVGVGVALLPLLWTLFNLSKLLSSYFGGSFSDRAPRVFVIVAGWIVYALTYVAFAFASEAWHAWALFFVYGSYYGLTEPVEKALVRDVTSPELRARAYGLYNFVIGATALPAGLLTGWLWDRVSPAAALATGAALAGAASLLLLAWARQTRVVRARA